MRTPADRVEAKAADIEIAARAVFESYKAVIAELDGVEWDALPDAPPEGDLHPMMVKLHYRRDVQTPVEALWRAGRLT